MMCWQQSLAKHLNCFHLNLFRWELYFILATTLQRRSQIDVASLQCCQPAGAQTLFCFPWPRGPLLAMQLQLLYWKERSMQQWLLGARYLYYYSRTPVERPPSPTTIPLIRPYFVWRTVFSVCVITDRRPSLSDATNDRVRDWNFSFILATTLQRRSQIDVASFQCCQPAGAQTHYITFCRMPNSSSLN